MDSSYHGRFARLSLGAVSAVTIDSASQVGNDLAVNARCGMLVLGCAILSIMKVLRALFVLLLCAVLPMSGLAASGLTGQCPMQASMANDDGNTISADMPDCDTMQSPSSTDKSSHPLCKVTAQCYMGSLYHPVSVPVMNRPAGLFTPVIFYYAHSFSVRSPDGFWRPPRFL